MSTLLQVNKSVEGLIFVQPPNRSYLTQGHSIERGAPITRDSCAAVTKNV